MKFQISAESIESSEVYRKGNLVNDPHQSKAGLLSLDGFFLFEVL